MNQSTSLRVGLLSYQIIGAVSCVFFLACGVAAVVAGQYWPALLFVFFLMGSAWMILSAGTFEFADEFVLQRTVWGVSRMRWAEVTRIEVGTQGTLVFHGDGKRFVLAPAGSWSGKQKPEACELLQRKIAELAVPTYPSNIGDYKTHKNVKVRQGDS